MKQVLVSFHVCRSIEEYSPKMMTIMINEN